MPGFDLVVDLLRMLPLKDLIDRLTLAGAREKEIYRTLDTFGPVIVQEVTSAMSELPNLGDVDVKLVWSPPWSPDMMSEDARDELGIW